MKQKTYTTVLIALLIVIVIGTALTARLNAQSVLTPEVMDCIKEISETRPPNYTPYVVVVRFKNNVTRSEAEALIDQHGLILSEFDSYSTVIVPLGSERIWVCILKSSDLVERTSLSYKTELA